MILVGRFCIAGDWDDSPTPDGYLRIVMVPLSASYGGGWQATTQAALTALPLHLKPGMSFAEIGAGSGILSVAAKLLGAGKCYATELSRDALAVMPRVFAANNVDVEIIDGTFVDTQVDLAVVSISTDWFAENHHNILADRILVVHDDAATELLLQGQLPQHTVALPAAQVAQTAVMTEREIILPGGVTLIVMEDGTLKLKGT